MAFHDPQTGSRACVAFGPMYAMNRTQLIVQSVADVLSRFQGVFEINNAENELGYRWRLVFSDGAEGFVIFGYPGWPGEHDFLKIELPEHHVAEWIGAIPIAVRDTLAAHDKEPLPICCSVFRKREGSQRVEHVAWLDL